LALPGGNSSGRQFSQVAAPVGSSGAAFGLAQPLSQLFGIIGIILQEQVPKRVAHNLAVVLINARFDLVCDQLLQVLA
jgi:hypothetical protein